MDEKNGPHLNLETTLLADLEGLDNLEAYRSFGERLRRLIPGELDTAPSRALTWLHGAISQDDLDFEMLLKDLDDQSRLGRAAAFCLVERFRDNPEILQDLILAPSPYKAPKANRFGSSHIIDLMGLSGSTELIPLLKRVLCENYHYHAPSWIARALENLGAEIDRRWMNDGRSITVTQNGSALFVHHDDRFGGSSNCPSCSFFPCRINDYYRGAIEDCKLRNRTSPAKLFEIVDYRPEAERGPTVEAQETPEISVGIYRRQAEASTSSGQLRQAAEAWQLAAQHAKSADEQLRWITQAMRTMICAGDRPAAYALATLTDDKVQASEDNDVLRRWERTFLSLQEELGVYATDSRNQYRTPQGRIQASLLAHFRRGPDQGLSDLASAVRMTKQYLLQTADDWLLYRWQSYLMSSYRVLSRPDLAKDMVSRTAAEFAADDPRNLETAVLKTRYRLYFEDAQIASKRFRRLLPEIRACQDPDRRLEYLGYVAEAASVARDWSFVESLALAREMSRNYAQALEKLSSAPSRKRLRERHQRTIEGILCLLMVYAEGPKGEMEGEGPAEAWRLIAATRNPELQRVHLALDGQEAGQLDLLENSLHRGLHYYQVEGSERGRFLDKFLRRVVDFEVAHVKRKQQPAAETDAPTSADQRVMWFAFRELEADGTYLLLVNVRARYRAFWLRDCDEIIEHMSTWQQYTEDLSLHESTLHGSDDLRGRREVSSARSRRRTIEKPDEALVRNAVGRLLGEILDASEDANKGTKLRDLYPEGPIYTLPLEALPDPAEPGSYIGERLAIRYCLRPRPRRSGDEMISILNGWIGLGGVPAPPGDVGRFGYLDGTRREIEALALDLKSRGASTVISLTGEEAHLENLMDALKKHQPSILHLAAHGIGDAEYPDACALVLAVEPGGAAGVLLPFRLIRDLPVDGIELAVLSACWSLVGPVGAGTGIEGLAWALLDAGVDHVLASRYPVSDQHTVTLMRCFYKHLFDQPPAEALRRARVDAHRLEGVPLRELGAWALWC